MDTENDDVVCGVDVRIADDFSEHLLAVVECEEELLPSGLS